MALQAAVRPDWLELLCDSDTPPDASKKRQRKSVERSAELLDECLELKEKYPVSEKYPERERSGVTGCEAFGCYCGYMEHFIPVDLRFHCV